MNTASIVLFVCLASASAVGTPGETPEKEQTGDFGISSTLAQVVGETVAQNARKILAPDEPISWEVHVPEGYSQDRPAGLLVYISPSPSGELPRGWARVMDDHNLIWVAANGSGNKSAAARRAILAVIAPTMIGKRYEIDRERIYLSGLSGGGRMASMVATEQAHLFKGAIYNSGADFWGRKSPPRINQIRQNHYVFIAGTQDQALEPTKKTYRKYKKAGVENVELMIIRDMTHRNPSRFKLSEAIEFLDSRLRQHE